MTFETDVTRAETEAELVPQVFSEFATYASAVTNTDRERLAKLGVPGPTLMGIHPLGANFGVAFVREAADGRWEPHAKGKPAIIVPVGWREITWSSMFDLIAFSLDDPANWRLRYRAVTILGEDEIDHARRALGGTVTVHASLLEWLKAQCDGIVILDWERLDPVEDLHSVRLHTTDSLRKAIQEKAIERTLSYLAFADRGRRDDLAT